jgi:hypothetical protein
LVTTLLNPGCDGCYSCDGDDCCSGLGSPSTGNRYEVSGVASTWTRTFDIAYAGTTTVVSGVVITISNLSAMNHARTLQRVDPCCGVENLPELTLGTVSVEWDCYWPDYTLSGSTIPAGSATESVNYVVSVSADTRTPSSSGIFSGPFPICSTTARLRFFADGGVGRLGVSGTKYERLHQFPPATTEFPGSFGSMNGFVAGQTRAVSTDGGTFQNIFSPAVLSGFNFLFECDHTQNDPDWWKSGLCKNQGYLGAGVPPITGGRIDYATTT